MGTAWASKPKDKVQIAIDMTDGCMRICADGIKQHSLASLKKSLEKLRKNTVG